jgi:hypothetical protein
LEPLNYFTLNVEGETLGAWYRIRAATKPIENAAVQGMAIAQACAPPNVSLDSDARVSP